MRLYLYNFLCGDQLYMVQAANTIIVFVFFLAISVFKRKNNDSM